MRSSWSAFFNLERKIQMKRFLFSLCIAFSLVFSFSAFAKTEYVSVYVNESELICPEQSFISYGRTMVAMRRIFEKLGATVDWDGKTKTIVAEKADKKIILQIGNEIMINNGVEEKLDTAPIMKYGSTFVPVRAVAQALEAEVEWSDYYKTVYINSPRKYSYDTSKKITVYAANNKPREIKISELSAYQKAGWSTSPIQYSSGSEVSSKTVYVNKTGERYHYKKSCAGKTAISTTLKSAKSVGKTACKKCVE